MATCKRCGYQWMPRKPFPVACPNQSCQAPWPLGKDPSRFAKKTTK